MEAIPVLIYSLAKTPKDVISEHDRYEKISRPTLRSLFLKYISEITYIYLVFVNVPSIGLTFKWELHMINTVAKGNYISRE